MLARTFPFQASAVRTVTMLIIGRGVFTLDSINKETKQQPSQKFTRITTLTRGLGDALNAFLVSLNWVHVVLLDPTSLKDHNFGNLSALTSDQDTALDGKHRLHLGDLVEFVVRRTAQLPLFVMKDQLVDKVLRSKVSHGKLENGVLATAGKTVRLTKVHEIVLNDVHPKTNRDAI